MLSFLLVSARKDLKRRFADPMALVIWVGIPVMLGGLMSLLGGGDGPPATAQVLVVDEDDSLLSELLVGALGRRGAGEFVSAELVDRDTGMARLDAGDGSALVVLPAGFGEAVLRDEATTVTVVTNPAQRIFPGLIVEGLELFGEVVFYGQRVLGEPLRTIAGGPPADADFFDSATVAEISVQINERLSGVGELLSPPALELVLPAGNEDGEDTARGGFDFARLFLPGVVFMSVLFIAQGMSNDLWDEKAGGTLRRVVSAPTSLAAFVGGKLLAGAGLIAMVATMAVAVGVVAFDLPVVRAPLAILWCAFAGTALLCAFFFLALLGSTQRAANLLSTMTMFPLMMIGGSFFPFETMPVWMREVGAWTPNGLAVVQLRTLLFETLEPASFMTAVLSIGALAGVTFFLCLRRLQGRFVTT